LKDVDKGYPIFYKVTGTFKDLKTRGYCINKDIEIERGVQLWVLDCGDLFIWSNIEDYPTIENHDEFMTRAIREYKVIMLKKKDGV
jgi:hypothetical protein